MRDIRHIIIHCAFTPASMDIGAETIRRWHTEPPRNWNDIGYHWVIRRDGAVEQGREERVSGAHALGRNHDSIGVCLVGGKPDCNFTRSQWESLSALVSAISRRYPDARVSGHRDHSGKDCPMFDAEAWWYGNGD